MKKFILFIFFTTSCSLNSNSTYLNESLNSNYELLLYDKNYTFEEYGKILKQYSVNKGIPKLK